MKKIFLGLAFAVISMMGSDVFAMSSSVKTKNIYKIGNNIHLMRSDDSCFVYNTIDGSVHFFAPDGTEIQPVSGENFAMAMSEIDRLSRDSALSLFFHLFIPRSNPRPEPQELVEVVVQQNRPAAHPAQQPEFDWTPYMQALEENSHNKCLVM